MATYERFVWKPVSPRRWEREIDEVEHFYTSLAKAYAGSGRTFFAMTGHISLAVPITTEYDRLCTEQRVHEALRKAWVRVRYDFPTIASWVEYDATSQRCKKIYEEDDDGFSTGSHDAWLQDTFHIIIDARYPSGQAWCNADPPVPRLATLFLIHRLATDQRVQIDLVLRAHHDVVDGIGTLHLFNRLLTYAAQIYEQGPDYQLPRLGGHSVVNNLSPPLRVAAAIPETLSDSQVARLEKIRATNAVLREGVEIASVPLQSEAPLPGKHQRLALTLERTCTHRLLTACKALGASVTHVYHTAIAMVVRDAQERRPEARTVRYINYSLINERGHCQSPYNTEAHAVSVYHSVSGSSLAIDLVVPSKGEQVHASGLKLQQEEFQAIVQQVRDFYLDLRDDHEHIALVPSYWAAGAIPFNPAPTPVPGPNLAPSASISSIGVIDNIIQLDQSCFVLEDPWVTGEELGTGLGFFLGTFKGELCLSVAYNDAWHNRSEVEDYLNHCNRIVFESLGVSDAIST